MSCRKQRKKDRRKDKARKRLDRLKHAHEENTPTMPLIPQEFQELLQPLEQKYKPIPESAARRCKHCEKPARWERKSSCPHCAGILCDDHHDEWYKMNKAFDKELEARGEQRIKGFGLFEGLKFPL